MFKRSSSTSNSKPLRLGGWLCLLCFIGLAAFITGVIMPQFSGEYLAAMEDKLERLESIHEPKIVLIGDSNVAFGFDSAMLEEAFHMPVVNMGLHGGLGADINERVARFGVNAGDIVVDASCLYDGDDRFGSSLAWTMLENRSSLWRLVERQDIPELINTFPAYLHTALQSWLNEAEMSVQRQTSDYVRAAFNAYGDYALPRDTTTFDFRTVGESASHISMTRARRINELNDYLTSRGATLVVAFYPLAYGEYNPSVDNALLLKSRIEAQLSCPLISDPLDYLFDYSLFYDTAFHLTTLGAQIRTQQLIDDLRQWMAGESADMANSADRPTVVHGRNPNLLPGTSDRLTSLTLESGDAVLMDWTDLSSLGLIDGETYTFSVFAAPDRENGQVRLRFATASSPNDSAVMETISEPAGETTDFAVIRFQYDAARPYARAAFENAIDYRPFETLQYKCLKLETGERHSGWVAGE